MKISDIIPKKLLDLEIPHQDENLIGELFSNMFEEVYKSIYKTIRLYNESIKIDNEFKEKEEKDVN